MRTVEVIEYFAAAARNKTGLPPTHATAEALEVTRQAVEQWGEHVPERIAYKVQVMTKGKLQVDMDHYSRARRKSA